MDFRLSGIGRELQAPCMMVVQGELADATRAAIRMLEQHPPCDEIEIFAGANFLRGVRRSLERLVA